MAITIHEKKDAPYYRVTNEFDEEATTLGFQQKLDPTYIGEREQKSLSLKKLQDPFMFMWDGVMHVIERGDSETLIEGVVKHLVGDWDLKGLSEWEKEQRRVLDTMGFIPKLKIERLLTPEEKAERAERYKAESRYVRPDIGEVKAKPTRTIPEVIEDDGKGFTEEAIDKAEKKKPGRPRKKAE